MTDSELEQDPVARDTRATTKPLLAEPTKLHHAFQKVSRATLYEYLTYVTCIKGKIRLRLHGARLPLDYTVALWISRSQKQKPQRAINAPRRRRRRRRAHPASPEPCVTDSENDKAKKKSSNQSAAHSDHEEDEEIRRNNAYTGALNSIGSVHQRTWYLALDRESSGFRRKRSPNGTSWERTRDRDDLLGFKPFYVQGRDFERSVITGRLGAEVLADEGVEGYVPRQGWQAVLV